MRPPCGVVSISPDRAIKDSVVTAFDYMRANKSRLGMERDIDNYDFHVQIVDLMQHFLLAMNTSKSKVVLPLISQSEPNYYAIAESAPSSLIDQYARNTDITH